jgi:hypothetical protein
MNEKPDPEPTSFQFHLLPGQSMSYPVTSVTPRKTAYLVKATAENLTTEVLKQWFKQCVVPLVGENAATILVAEAPDSFWSAAMAFRQGLIDSSGS